MCIRDRVNAIESDDLGRAYINPDRCVSCGMCMVNCPFGAIADKSQIFQLIRALKEGGEIVAEVAPAIVGQFGPHGSPKRVKAALMELGFSEVYEVALGADMGAATEARHYVEEVVNGDLPFLLTSCCPVSYTHLLPAFDSKFFLSLSILVLAVGGCEKISPYVNKMKNPSRDFPKGMIALAIMVAVCAVLGTVALGMMFDSENIPPDLMTNGAYYEMCIRDSSGRGQGTGGPDLYYVRRQHRGEMPDQRSVPESIPPLYDWSDGMRSKTFRGRAVRRNLRLCAGLCQSSGGRCV